MAGKVLGVCREGPLGLGVWAGEGTSPGQTVRGDQKTGLDALQGPWGVRNLTAHGEYGWLPVTGPTPPNVENCSPAALSLKIWEAGSSGGRHMCESFPEEMQERGSGLEEEAGRERGGEEGRGGRKRRKRGGRTEQGGGVIST